MAESLKSKLLPQALALIAEGVKKQVAAKSIGVHEATLRRWVRESRGAVPALPAVAGTKPTNYPGTVPPVGPVRRTADAATNTCPATGPAPRAVGAPVAPSPVAALPLPPARGAGPRHARTPDASARLARRLEERLAVLVEKSEASPNDPKLEDRMLKVCKVLEYLRAGEDDLDAQLAAMKRFAGFCIRTLSEDEMTPVRKAIRLFLDDLKREHS